MDDSIFPHIKKAVEDFVDDQEGNIPRSKILTVGSMLLILGMILVDPAYAAHRSHKSHRSHRSHSSGGHRSHYSHYSSYGGGHSSRSHSSHGSHSSHTSHASGSHSNYSSGTSHASHNNVAPTRSFLQSIKAPLHEDTVNIDAVIAATQVQNQVPPETTPIQIPPSETTSD